MNTLLEKINTHLEHKIRQPKLILAVSMLLLILLAWLLGKFFVQFLHAYTPPNIEQKTIAELHISATGVASYLFGEADNKPAPPPKVDLSKTKDSRLNLQLVGVISSSDDSIAMIVIAGKTKLFFEGQEIQRNVRLLDVLPEQIVVENHGVKERISLNRAKNILLSTHDPVGQTVDQEVFNTGVSIKLQEIGQTLRKSPMSIAKFLRLKPVHKNGQLIGVQIWPKADKELFRSVGFEEGDLLLKVNDLSVEEISKNPRLWQEFLQQTQFALVVERDGLEHSVTIDFSGS